VTEIRDYGGWLELSRAGLLHNLEGVQRLVEPAQVMAVVKANAYGAGATGMARALQEGGVERFAVATVDEGVALRDAGVHGEIVCLTYFDASDTDAIRVHDLTPTVFSEKSASLLGDAAAGGDARLKVWVKVDTGLGRLGVPADDAAAFIDGVRRDTPLVITGIYSTLAESRDGDRQQLGHLLALRGGLPALSAARWSLASSHGILTLPESCLDVVRPGVMLLGFPPSEPERMDAERVTVADLTPIVTWKTRVSSVKIVPAGGRVGYGEQAPLAGDTRVAGLMIGWADGYTGSPHSESHVLIGGHRCPVLALSANTTLVDVTVAAPVESGDEAVLLGSQGDAEISVDALARAGGGVYRMLARIPAGVPRVWS
jgi:alanine racemase